MTHSATLTHRTARRSIDCIALLTMKTLLFLLFHANKMSALINHLFAMSNAYFKTRTSNLLKTVCF